MGEKLKVCAAVLSRLFEYTKNSLRVVVLVILIDQRHQAARLFEIKVTVIYIVGLFVLP